ncbi:MAG: extracellular solute-binding protein [Deinococcota bacterium]
MKARVLFVLVALAVGFGFAQQEVTIEVWAGGSNDNDHYRVDAIEMAADILEREMSIMGQEIDITVTGQLYSGWDEFKQAFTLAAEAGEAPHIVVTSHADIAPWAQAGYIRPVEDYLDLGSWPLNNVYDNLWPISSFDGTVYAVPQDAESRPFFFWIPHMRAIGYSDADIAALPDAVLNGEYTLQNVLEDAKKMQDAGLVAEGMGFYPRVSNGPDYWQFYQSFGGDMFDEETGKLIFDAEVMTNFFQFFADAVDMGVTRKNHIGTEWDQWYAEVASGQAGLWHGGTWHYARYTGREGLDDFFGNVQFTLIPAGNEMGRANTITHPLVYLISNRGSEDDAFIAAELIKIATEPRINSLHAIKSAHLAIARAQSEVELYANDQWAASATDRLLPHANAMPNSVDFGTYWDAMWSNLEAAWTGTKTVEQAVADAQAEVEAALGDGVIIR